jgi:ArsR family transcriptional regulator, lead/cadmium/zinc/bismuth-responsive transcriptional repressor
MHLLPAERADHRVIDEERVCHAIAAAGDPESIRTRAQHYAVLGCQ